MSDNGNIVTEERRLLRHCCYCAFVCFVLILGVVIFQAATGAALAVMSLRAPPEGGASTAGAISLYSTLRSLHGTVGQFVLLPAFGLLAASILFTMNVGAVATKHTRFSWAQLLRAILVCAVLVGTSVGGRMFAVRLENADFWLMLKPEQLSATRGITMHSFSSTYFYTFLGLHGIVLPFLVVITIIFMWTPVYEFIRGWRRKTTQTTLRLRP